MQRLVVTGLGPRRHKCTGRCLAAEPSVDMHAESRAESHDDMQASCLLATPTF